MDDFFAAKLSSGPLAGILNKYSSNKLLTKSRITTADREEVEDEELQKLEQQSRERKKRKRQEMNQQEMEKYILSPRSKKMKLSSDRNSDPLHDPLSQSRSNSPTNDPSDTNESNPISNDKSQSKLEEKKEEVHLNLTPEQVITRLRELQQPIRYFGETNEERLKRLRRLEILEHEREEGASKGLKNVSQSIKNEVERELEAAMAQCMYFMHFLD